jgi:PPP family 3-phenylpropionic acid transporter
LNGWSGREIRVLLLFMLIYGAFGIQSPFFPVYLKEREFEASTIGLLLASATAIKLVSAPLLGRIADRFAAVSGVLATMLAGCALTSVGLVLAPSNVSLGMMVAAQSFFLGPVPTIADALALNSGLRLSYGPLRGSGAGAFVFCLTASGYFVEQLGLTSIFVANAVLNAMAAVLIGSDTPHGQSSPLVRASSGSVTNFMPLLKLRTFRLVILIAGLVLGSHALHDGFTIVRWREAGLSPSMIGLLWSMSVSSEVLVFFFLGAPLLRSLGPAGACFVASLVASLRWALMAMTVSIPIMLIVQPMHGISFALLHLACMRLITDGVPVHLAATAQGVYATLGPGLASVLVTSVSGFMFARWGAGAFWAMSLLSAIAILPAWRLSISPSPNLAA